MRTPEALVQLGVAFGGSSEGGLAHIVFGSRMDETAKSRWEGQALSLFLDDDPLWQGLLESTNLLSAIDDSAARPPIGLSIEVADFQGAQAYLDAERTRAKDASEESAKWETRVYRDVPYQRIHGNDPGTRVTQAGFRELFCLLTRERLLLAGSESVVRRAIDRLLVTNTSPALLGTNFSLQRHREGTGRVPRGGSRFASAPNAAGFLAKPPDPQRVARTVSPRRPGGGSRPL